MLEQCYAVAEIRSKFYNGTHPVCFKNNKSPFFSAFFKNDEAATRPLMLVPLDPIPLAVLWLQKKKTITLRATATTKKKD